MTVIFNCNTGCEACLASIRSNSCDIVIEEVSIWIYLDMDETVVWTKGLETFSAGLTDEQAEGFDARSEEACCISLTDRTDHVVWVNPDGRVCIFHHIQHPVMNDGVQVGWERFCYRAEVCELAQMRTKVEVCELAQMRTKCEPLLFRDTAVKPIKPIKTQLNCRDLP